MKDFFSVWMQRIETRISVMESKIDSLAIVVNKSPSTQLPSNAPPAYNVVSSLFQPPPISSMPTTAAPVPMQQKPDLSSHAFEDTSNDEVCFCCCWFLHSGT